MKRIILTVLVGFVVFALQIRTSSANAISVSSFSADQSAGTVTFTLAWDNGWWDGTNWDAAWVFVKFRSCDSASAQFQHGLLSTTITDHTLGNFQATNASGIPDAIDASANNTGILLRRDTPGSGSISSSVTLKLTNLPSSGFYDIRVYAIEMVFIPQGAFMAGDGNGTFQSHNAFYNAISTAYPVTSENPFSINPIAGALTAAFPKGYNAFFIMKYEISQGQYADFLNGSGSGQASIRYPLGVFNTYRFQIDNTGSYPQNYVTYRPDRACNFLSWADVTGYLDWAALRPLTELQYEKAARGGGSAMPGECAWGNNSYTLAGIISGAETGAEMVTTANANLVAGNTFFAGGDGGQGPVRCGIFATAVTTTRLQTGASYWGVMELCGNVREICIHAASGISTAPSSSGVSWGNGYINASGEHDVGNWPNTTSQANYIIWRGGDWNILGNYCSSAGGVATCSVSNRYFSGLTFYTRVNTCGGRGIR